MKVFFLLLALLVVGAYAYPSWREETSGSCAALEKRAGVLANIERQGPIASSSGHATLASMMRDASGGMAEAAVSAALPGVPPSIACSIGYWRLMFAPDINRLLASAH